MTTHLHVGFCQEHILRLKSQWSAERAAHATDSYQRSSQQQSAKRNLNAEQEIAQCESTENGGRRRATSDCAQRVCAPDLPGWKEAG